MYKSRDKNNILYGDQCLKQLVIYYAYLLIYLPSNIYIYVYIYKFAVLQI